MEAKFKTFILCLGGNKKCLQLQISKNSSFRSLRAGTFGEMDSELNSGLIISSEFQWVPLWLRKFESIKKTTVKYNSASRMNGGYRSKSTSKQLSICSCLNGSWFENKYQWLKVVDSWDHSLQKTVHLTSDLRIDSK